MGDCQKFFINLSGRMADLVGFLTSITSRCSGKGTHAHPPEGMAGLVRFLLMVLANQNTACRFLSGINYLEIIIFVSESFSKCLTRPANLLREEQRPDLRERRKSSLCKVGQVKMCNA